MRHIERGPLWLAFEHPDPCLVLIDEIDKAPRDFPNDLLQELDKQEFPHPFSSRKEDAIRADRARLPLVLVTSNNERRLPDAFLRRCIVHHIAMTPGLMERAVAAHGAAVPALGPGVREAAIARFQELRRQDRLSRKPGIAELLAWLVTLARARPGIRAADLKTPALADLPHLHCLIKDQDDIELLREQGRR
jgi:MoxR-like ATPase